MIVEKKILYSDITEKEVNMQLGIACSEKQLVKNNGRIQQKMQHYGVVRKDEKSHSEEERQ